MARAAVKILGVSKNYLINGNFDFWQRKVSQQVVTGTRVYGADRWLLFPSSASAGASQVLRATSTNVGSQYDLQFGPWNQNEKCSVAQILESNSTALLRGKEVTFSVYVKSDTASPIRLQLLSWTGTADSVTTFTNAVPYTNWTSYTLATSFSDIASATGTTSTSYQRFSVTGTIPTSANNLICVVTYNENSGHQQYVSQAMLNEGAGPHNFSLAGSNLAGELVMCQRYYEKSYGIDTAPGTQTYGSCSAFLSGITANVSCPTLRWTIRKRPAPTVTLYSPIGSPAPSGYIRNITTATDIVAAIGFLDDTAATFSASQTDQHEYRYHWTVEAEL